MLDYQIPINKLFLVIKNFRSLMVDLVIITTDDVIALIGIVIEKVMIKVI